MKTTILQGCCLTELQKLPSDSVDCVVTSPPYWGLRDYGVPPSQWPKVTFAPMPGLQLNYKLTIQAETSCLGLEPRLESFIGHIVLIFREIHRVLKPTGTCWVNMGDGYTQSPGQHKAGDSAGGKQGTNKGSDVGLPACPFLKPKDLQGQPWRLAFALQADGWYLRSDIIWHKPNPMPESTQDRATKSHEYFFMLTKSKSYFFDTAAWAEPVSVNTHARLAQNVQDQIGSARANGNTRPDRPMKAVYKTPDGWDTGKGGHGTFHRQGREKGKTLPAHDGRVKNNASMDASLAIMPLTRNRRTVWTVPTAPYKEAHYATYPPDLIRPCIRAGCPPQGVVLDPFGGSGTTAQVALEEGRSAILIEVGPHNVALIEKRLSNFTPGLSFA